jgi:hypothetical protein
MASVNIVFQRVRKTDPISHGFELVLKYVLDVDLDVRLWSQYISFFFIGVLVRLDRSTAQHRTAVHSTTHTVRRLRWPRRCAVS